MLQCKHASEAAVNAAVAMSVIEPYGHDPRKTSADAWLLCFLEQIGANGCGSKPTYHFAPPILEPTCSWGLGCSLGDNRDFHPWPNGKTCVLSGVLQSTLPEVQAPGERHGYRIY